MANTKYINPFTDFGFKRIFGTEANKDLLIDFLNCMFNFRVPVVDIQFKNAEQIPQSEQQRKAIFDVSCTDAQGKRFMVEMQKGKLLHFKDRALFYVSYPILDCGQKGVWDFCLDEIYYLALLDFEYDSKVPKLERLVQLKGLVPRPVNNNQIIGPVFPFSSLLVD